MKLAFSIDGTPAVLTSSNFTGSIKLDAAGTTTVLQNPWSPATHFSFQLTRAWSVQINGHRIFIEKTRPLLLAGFRDQTYRVKVDGQLVAEKTGY
jgi:hypothetical protein